jgi:NAD(P)-dependent dehydrogenase (short-subunit alcohol dehydrogenase family)
MPCLPNQPNDHDEVEVMSDQVWFVTASSRGLGRAVVEEALKAGNRVVATARRPEALHDLAASPNGHLLAVPLDVTNPAQADAAIRSAVDAFGRVDVVVNNAGFRRRST